MGQRCKMEDVRWKWVKDVRWKANLVWQTMEMHMDLNVNWEGNSEVE